MNILMVAPTPYFSDRGCHIRIFGEAQALAVAGHHVTIATYHLGRNVSIVPTIRIPRIPWYRKTEAGPSWQKPFLDLLLLLTILIRVRKKNVDIVHAHLHEGALIGWLLKFFWKKPLLFDAQGSLVRELQSYGTLHYTCMKKIFEYIERFIMRHVDAIVTSSSSLANWMQTTFPKQSSRITVLADALPDNKTPKAKQDIHAFTIIYAGGLASNKGVDLLVDAFAVLHRAHSEVKLLLIGDDTDDIYHDRVKELGLQDAVTFAGHLDYGRLHSFLQGAHVAVDPKSQKSSESSGKILEYLAAGLPVVAFNRPANRTLLRHAGILVEEQSVKALHDALEDLRSNHPKREQLRQAAQQAVANETWSARIPLLTKIYDELKQS